MKHRAVANSDQGRVRDHNEDSYLIDELLGLYVVCDGVGGHAAGEIASQTACRAVQKTIMAKRGTLDAHALAPSNKSKEDLIKLVRGAIQVASHEVYRVAQKNQRMRGMATTIVLVLVVGDGAVLAHVGDSRIYLLRRGQVHQLTEDHSLSAEQAKRGLTPNSTRKTESVMTRAVGYNASVNVDTLYLDLTPGDRLLMCSDGLSDYFQTNHEFGQFCEQYPFEELPQRLIEFANESGGKDNITPMIVEIDPNAQCQGVNPAHKIEAVRKTPLFQGLDYRELLQIVSAMHHRVYKPGEQVIREGSKAEAAFINVTGTMRVIKNDHVITKLPPGSFFGEMALVDDAPRSADVIAEDKSTIIIIHRDNFFPLVRGDARLAMKVLWALCRMLTHRLRQTSEKLSWAQNNLNDSLAGFDVLIGKETPKTGKDPTQAN